MIRENDCPPHYRGDGDIHCDRAMESMVVGWMRAEPLPPMAVYWGESAFKYLWRWPLKDAPLKDIDKAIDCLQKLRASLDKE